MKSNQYRSNACFRSCLSAVHPAVHPAVSASAAPPAVNRDRNIGGNADVRKVYVAMRDRNLTLLHLESPCGYKSSAHQPQASPQSPPMQFWRVKAAVNASNVIAPKIRHQVKQKTGRDLLDIAALTQKSKFANSKQNLVNIVQHLQRAADRKLSVLTDNLQTMLSAPPTYLDGSDAYISGAYISGSDAYISGGYIAEPYFNPRAPRNDEHKKTNSSIKRTFVYGKRKFNQKVGRTSELEDASTDDSSEAETIRLAMEAARLEAEAARLEAEAARLEVARQEAETARLEAERIAAEAEAALRCKCPKENETLEQWQERISETSEGAQICWSHKGIADAEFDEYWDENSPYFEEDQWNYADINSTESDWKVCLEGTKYKVWRKPLPGTNVYSYKVQASFDDIVARDMFTVQTDLQLRQEWDEYITELRVIASDPQTDSELVHWITNCPRPMQPREYVYKRRTRVDPDRGIMMVFNEATRDAINVPTVANIFRVNTYTSKLLLKSNKNADEDGVDFVLTYHDNPESNAPTFIVNKIALHGIGVVMGRIQNVSKRLRQERNRESSNAIQL